MRRCQSLWGNFIFNIQGEFLLENLNILERMLFLERGVNATHNETVYRHSHHHYHHHRQHHQDKSGGNERGAEEGKGGRQFVIVSIIVIIVSIPIVMNIIINVSIIIINCSSFSFQMRSSAVGTLW